MNVRFVTCSATRAGPHAAARVASANGTFGAVDRLQRSLGVDVRVGGQQEPKLAAAADQICSHRASQPRHDRVEQLVGGRRGLLAPQRIGELWTVAPDAVGACTGTRGEGVPSVRADSP